VADGSRFLLMLKPLDAGPSHGRGRLVQGRSLVLRPSGRNNDAVMELSVIWPDFGGQRFACHGCTNCCRELVVHLTAEDRRKIDRQKWGRTLDEAPYVRLGGGTVLNHGRDGAWRLSAKRRPVPDSCGVRGGREAAGVPDLSVHARPAGRPVSRRVAIRLPQRGARSRCPGGRTPVGARRPGGATGRSLERNRRKGRPCRCGSPSGGP